MSLLLITAIYSKVIYSLLSKLTVRDGNYANDFAPQVDFGGFGKPFGRNLGNDFGEKESTHGLPSPGISQQAATDLLHPTIK